MTRSAVTLRGVALATAGIVAAAAFTLVLLLTNVAAQGESLCTVVPDKVAAPPEILLGETVRVTLTLNGSCPSESNPLDVVLVVDESASMQDASKIENARAAAMAFLAATDFEQSRVGLVTFTNGEAALRVQLRDDPQRIESALNNLLPAGLTNISRAIQIAHDELLRDPRGARLAIVVLTDGRQTQPGAEPIVDAADRAKADAITIATFCAGDDCDPELETAASSPDLHFDVPDPSQLPDLYRELAGTLQANGFATLTIRDEIPDNMTYIVGSAVPAPDEVTATHLTWRFNGLPPLEGISYLLRPEETGLHPTNVVAIGEFTDEQGRNGETEFPIPEVRVRDPECLSRPLEVYFLIDDSNCLYGQLLNGMNSLEAIRLGVDSVLAQMDLSVDKAAVIGFGDRAIRFQTLTSDRQAVLDGVQRLTMRDGSARLDLAFDEVVKELESERHDPNAHVVTLTVTDGPMMQIPELAEVKGIAVRQKYGARHYAVGVGFISQHSVLRAISEPGGYYEIPFGGDVITPMEAIGTTAVDIARGCPPDPNSTPGAPTATPTRSTQQHIFLPRTLAQ